MSSSVIIRVFPAYIKGPPAKVLAVDERFIKLWAAYKGSRTDAINKVFEAGLEAEEKREDLETPQTTAIQKKHQDVMQELATQGELEFIYEHLSRPEFVSFCKENDIDYQKFLKNYGIKLPSVGTKSKIMKDWLKYVLADGDEHAIADIKEKAKIEHIVRDETDWSLMKNVASRAGYSGSGERGCWREKVKS